MEWFIRDEMIQLPDLIVDHLAKFLRPQDCFNVSVSNTFHRFGFFHGQKRHLTISKAYSLTEYLWKKFFKQWVNPSRLVYFDASHCYWLSKEALIKAITTMPNLENLKIQDTKVCLSDLPAVFVKCAKITQLSLDVLELKLEDCQKGVDNDETWTIAMLFGFQRLTHLSIFSLATNIERQKQSWMVILALLGWCEHCTHLHIELAFFMNNYPPPAWQNYGVQNRTLDPVLVDLFADLQWMVHLNSLTIYTKQQQLQFFTANNLGPDLFVFLVNLRKNDERARQRSLQNLWIDGMWFAGNQTFFKLIGNNFSSLNTNLTLDEASKFEKFRNLEYLYAGGGFSRVSENFPMLRFVGSNCVDKQGLNDFCQDHPQLEGLNFFTKDQPSISLEGQWNLPKLKYLFYSSRLNFQKDAVEKLVKKCPNLEELHFKVSQRIQGHQSIDAIDAIAFERLKMLNIDRMDMKDGFFLLKLWEKCPKLESLFLRGLFEREKFFTNLTSSLPLSQNLRDLRLEWFHKEEESKILDLVKSLSKIRSLERVILLTDSFESEDWIASYDPLEDVDSSPPLSKSMNVPEFFVKFVSGLPRLVALCLFCFQFDFVDLKEIYKKLSEEILPSRPSFWFKIGSSESKPDFFDAPQIHRYGIVELCYPPCRRPTSV